MDTKALDQDQLTEKSLETLIVSGTLRELVDACKPLTEKERRSFSRYTSDLYKAIRNRGPGQKISSEVRALFQRVLQGKTSSLDKNIQLALLAMCPLSVVKRMDLWHMASEEEALLIEVLLDRQPAWLDQWLEVRFEKDMPGISWKGVQTLIRAGACKKPTGDGYIKSMASYFLTWEENDPETLIPLSERLLKAPEILEKDVFRLFELESDAFVILRSEEDEGAFPGYESWITALSKLAEAGHVDRSRLLDASLRAMTSSMSPSQLSGFRKMHERLKPSVQEIKDREKGYGDLIATRVSHVMGLGIKSLKKLHRKKQLDIEAFLEAVHPVFEESTKGPAKEVLKVALRYTGSDAHHEKLSNLALKAMHHLDGEVQEMAFQLLEQVADREDEALVDALKPIREMVSPLLLERIDAWAGTESDSAHQMIEELAFDEVKERADDITPLQLKRVGLNRNQLMDAFPGMLQIGVMESSVLAGLEPVEPIQSLDELIQATWDALEDVDSANEIERILDGISRLCTQRPDSFEARTSALLHKLKHPISKDSIQGMADGPAGITLRLRGLLLTWVTGRYNESRDAGSYEPSPMMELTGDRIEELRKRVLRGQAGPLLAAPTHEAGWIDPVVFVRRLVALEEDPLSALRVVDFTQALLRLAPDGRGQALKEAAAIEENAGRLVQWALGGDVEVLEDDKWDYALWIAAGRARSPRGRLDALEVFNVEDNWPDSISPATFQWNAYTEEVGGDADNISVIPRIALDTGSLSIQSTDSEKNESIARIRNGGQRFFKSLKSMVVASPLPHWSALPTVALHTRSTHTAMSLDLNADWLVQWVFMIWPQHIDSVLAAGVASMMDRIDENGVAFAPHYAYLEPAFETNRPWTEMMMLAMWVGLVSRDTELRTTAADAMIEGIDDGRGHPASLGRILLKLADGGWVKMNRLADAVRMISQVSSLQQYVMCDVLENVVLHTEGGSRNMHDILQLLLEMHVLLEKEPSGALRSVLKTYTGNGKAARIARQIEALKTNGDVPAEVLIQAIEARLERAEALTQGSV